VRHAAAPSSTLDSRSAEAAQHRHDGGVCGGVGVSSVHEQGGGAGHGTPASPELAGDSLPADEWQEYVGNAEWHLQD